MKKTLVFFTTILVVLSMLFVLTGCSNNENATSQDNKNASNVPEEKIATEYLADKVVIGDYVDLGINYENQYAPGDDEDEKTTLTGWRVLEVIGNGETGYVKLISAGNPITYYHGFYPDRDITPYVEMLNNLNTEITLVSSGTEGFVKNGFSSNNLTEVFSSNEYVDMTKGIHSIGCASSKDGTETDGELERLYAAISGTTLTMTQLDDNSDWPCSNETLGLTEDSKAYSLIANGSNYFVAGKPKAGYTFWEMSYNGWIENSARTSMGVRPVVTLKAGLKTLEGSDGVWSLSK